MVDGGGPDRPVGWWVKRVDRLLDAAFDRALAEAGGTRREWQVLSSLQAAPVPAEELLRWLEPFDTPDDLATDLDHLIGRGLVHRSSGMLSLAPAGEARLAALRPAVAGVRRLVTDALPGDDHPALVRLLARLAHGLTADAGDPPPG